MDFASILLVVIALVPGIVLLRYIYKKDRVEKEPVGLLILLLFLGAAICFPAGEIEGFIGENIINKIFMPLGQMSGNDLILPTPLYHVYCIVDNFIGIALVEEGLKWIVLFFVTRKNKNFNSMFDGVVYAVFVSLGFAMLENVLYAFSFGLETTLMRAVTSIPGHMFFSIFMGFFYSQWFSSVGAEKLEKAYIDRGLLSSSKKAFYPWRFLARSLIIPVFVHGFYDYCCTVDTAWAMPLFYIFLIGLYVFCFSKIKKLSKEDTSAHGFSIVWLVQKHPELKQIVLNELSQVGANQNGAYFSYAVNNQKM